MNFDYKENGEMKNIIVIYPMKRKCGLRHFYLIMRQMLMAKKSWWN